MQTTLKWMLSLLVLASLSSFGCSADKKEPYRPPAVNPPDPPAADPIHEFVQSQPIPKQQPVHIIAVAGDVTFFDLDYGDIHEDMAGDWYDSAWGVRNGPKVGWITMSGRLADSTGLVMYDPLPDDVHLFEEETWSALRSASDSWLYWGGFMPMLARDADVPAPTLLAIAEQLNTYISPYVGWLLVNNPIVRTNRDILTVLANLPVFQGDAYAPVRQQAQTLLYQLPPA
ncbi:MAG TPA: hypothetical protein VFX78_10475 [Candidatus Eisenbacteria bacterium]|jgi:hypothetical protein|nr:hypothetical protein [Candidatus Eisenbacteria bacterium]